MKEPQVNESFEQLRFFEEDILNALVEKTEILTPTHYRPALVNSVRKLTE
ncbi:hypothetical protein [Desulfosporosinus fructosivorans]